MNTFGGRKLVPQILGVCGVGVIGTALLRALGTKFEVLGYDKYKPEYQDKEALLLCRMIFVCVPTATNSNGYQDLSPLLEVCKYLAEKKYQGIVVIRCTVLPGTCEQIVRQFGLRIVHNPEFLTAKTPFKDLMNQKCVVLGGDLENCAVVAGVFLQVTPETSFNFSDLKTSETIKYTHNCFLATKLSFFQELYQMCQKLEIDYKSVMRGAHSVGQIGRGHTTVPNEEGHTFWGGMCFPKDTSAFLRFAKDQNIDLGVLEAAVTGNSQRASTDSARTTRS